MIVDVKVLVTGGTGFVGSHAVAAMARAGHDLCVLVRRPEQVFASLAPLGVAVADIAVGDVLDERGVSRAGEGCEAAVHAAHQAWAAELVLNSAANLGLDPVVHVSTTVALTRYGGSGPDLPLGDIDLPYAQSKIASEKVARRLQETGAPVVTIYPGAVYGPNETLDGYSRS